LRFKSLRPARAWLEAIRPSRQDESMPLDSDTVRKGRDILVHEAMYVPGLERTSMIALPKGRQSLSNDSMPLTEIHHSPAENVGRIAKQAGSTPSFSHLTPGIR
jgi:ribonuclease BN (tRNA processing enzyme)